MVRFVVAICAALAVLATTGQAVPSLNGKLFAELTKSVGNGQCAKHNDECYTSAHCCDDDGLVCAVLDEYVAMNPDTPGICMKEKDADPCVSDADCRPGHACMRSGYSERRYCLKTSQQPRAQPNGQSRNQGAGGGLGAPCETTNDCNPFTVDGESALCCQRVQRGRLGTKTMCDRVNIISKCLAK